MRYCPLCGTKVDVDFVMLELKVERKFVTHCLNCGHTFSVSEFHLNGDRDCPLKYGEDDKTGREEAEE